MEPFATYLPHCSIRDPPGWVVYGGTASGPVTSYQPVCAWHPIAS